MALIGLIGLALAQDYRFPTTEEDYAEFYPTAYVDHGGTTDWSCGSFTYSGHRGSDFGGGSWSGMDAGRDVVAAATGIVSYTNDGEFDRCDTGDCDGGGGFGNYVAILHADGKTTWYGHLKQWSVLVSAGQTVTCGQKLGEMGSSGHSTGPHLHFEVRESSGSSSDPFYGDCANPPSYWVSQGTYGELPAAVCESTEPCTPAGRLSCGQQLSGRNDGAGATQSHGVYGCVEFAYSGPELAWSFATDRDEAVTLRLSGLAADLDLFVLGSTACDASDCIGASSSEELTDEALQFTASAGVTYTVLVDGWEGAVSDFVLGVECAGSWPGEDSGVPKDAGPADSEAWDFVGPPGARVRRDSLGCAVGSGALSLWAPLLGMVLLRRRAQAHRR